MNVLLIGSGGREHALAWKLLQSPLLSRLFLNTTNASGMLLQRQFPERVQLLAIADGDFQPLIQTCLAQQINLVMVGSETQLSLGLADAFAQAGIAVFGPSQAAAMIESSKAFAKDFMHRYNIPSAAYRAFSDYGSAVDYVQTVDFPLVIKASGLAAGKGVFLPNSTAEAITVLQDLLQQATLGSAAAEVIIEQRLSGEEVSLLAFSDGHSIKVMPPVRDHKRIFDHDLGPNTGGMGTYAPAIISMAEAERLAASLILPAVQGLKDEGKPFVGVLYAGLMLTADGPMVLEYNCRFGDPETQVLMPLLQSDLLAIAYACTQGNLAQTEVLWRDQHAACVVMASAGYPASSTTGQVISGLSDEYAQGNVFHAGTKVEQDHVLTAGGRVLGVTAWGDSLADALTQAYQMAEQIHFEGRQFRRDIGQTVDHYAAAGVNIAEGARAVELMKAAVKSTYSQDVLAGIGAFGGMFSANALKNLQDPVLVASIDGIGTKVHLAAKLNRVQHLGYDIVNHSINDILVQGAKPLFFLDYVAASKISAEHIATLVNSMSAACREAGCALLGGETAEMPGVYHDNTFDVAGTIVGVVERARALPRDVQAGDVLLGLASASPHTNGYSLIQKIFEQEDYFAVRPELNTSLADALLTPHRSYLPILDQALADAAQPIKALIHITGGGFIENIPRILPEQVQAVIDVNALPKAPLFALLQVKGNIPREQMFRVFNMGIGMILVVAPEQVARVQKLLPEPAFTIGHLVAGARKVVLQ